MSKHRKKELGESLGAFEPLLKADESAKVASFYGFTPIVGPSITEADTKAAKDLDPDWSPREKISFLREFEEAKNHMPVPLMCWVQRPFKGSGERVKPMKTECDLVILNSGKNVAEKLLLQASKSILHDLGFKNIAVRINSVGYKDCVAEFERKVFSFIRKKIDSFPPDLRQEVRKDPYYIIRNNEERFKEFKEEAPQPMDYLNEQSRLHLKEILEFMETIELPYSIDPFLLGDMSYATETVFEIYDDSDKDTAVLARGCRWNRLSRKLNGKKEVPAASVSLSFKTAKKRGVTLKRAASKFYLIQFGPEAKQKSFLALEELRRAGVSVSHSLAKDKLLGQMSAVETMNVPYVILIGQKEALEGNVLVRNSATRVQSIVSIGELGQFVKKIK